MTIRNEKEATDRLVEIRHLIAKSLGVRVADRGDELEEELAKEIGMQSVDVIGDEDGKTCMLVTRQYSSEGVLIICDYYEEAEEMFAEWADDYAPGLLTKWEDIIEDGTADDYLEAAGLEGPYDPENEEHQEAIYNGMEGDGHRMIGHTQLENGEFIDTNAYSMSEHEELRDRAAELLSIINDIDSD